MFRRLDETIMVAGQIAPEDIAEAKRLGATMVINNRPEGEQPGQPTSDEIAAAAQAAGLGYRAIPITPGGFSQDQVDAMREALDAAPGPVLAFCRSGTRSTFVWALARLAEGDDPVTLAEKASAQGYDITPLLR